MRTSTSTFGCSISGSGTGTSLVTGTVSCWVGSGTDTGSGSGTITGSVSIACGFTSGLVSTTLGVGGTYAASTSLAIASPLDKLAIGVTWPATSNAACTSLASESKASLFAAGFDIKDSTPLRYFVASPSPPVC